MCITLITIKKPVEPGSSIYYPRPSTSTNMHNIGLLICRLGGNAYQVMAGRGQLILIFLQNFLSSNNTKSKI